MPRLSAVRRFALWLFSEPASPYVSTNVVIDFAAARAYLEQLNSGNATLRVTVQHLFTAAVALVLREFPQANGRVVGRRIERFSTVDVAAPVNLLDHDGSGVELGMVLLHAVDRMSLREIARQTSKHVAQERSGRPSHPFVRLGMPIARYLPGPLFDVLLDVGAALARTRMASPLVRRFLGVSTVISNPGAAFRDIEGGRFIGASMNPPTRMLQIASVFGISAIQSEVFVVDGEPAVRPGLPVLFIFDHRLFDGVFCGRMLRRLIEILQDPAHYFGTDGQ